MQSTNIYSMVTTQQKSTMDAQKLEIGTQEHTTKQGHETT